jgi:3-deoxy-7-phosphoheptulonate synthase
VKLGPTATGAQAIALAQKLNPDNIPGRLTFVVRMGADKVRDNLPQLVRTVRDAGIFVTWLSDPMHGNTFTSESGYKTRRLETILDEVTGFFEVHEALGTVPGGLLVELTGDDVTEVMGGTEEIDDASLALRYETKVDPRLNHQQSLELAFLVSELLAKRVPRVETI